MHDRSLARPDWLAEADYAHLFDGVGFDVWYTDNNFWKPRSEPDRRGPGKIDGNDDIKVRNWWRDGQRACRPDRGDRSGYQKIAGTQAPAVNDGKPVTSVTLSERDGLLLVRP